MKTYYITSTRDQYTDYEVCFYDLDKAKEYARWKGYKQLEAYEYNRYSNTIEIDETNMISTH